jgi:lipopolysaccharide export system protein LptC
MKAMDRPADFGQASVLMEELRVAPSVRSRPGADRYSRGVTLLKRVLPAVGAVLLLLVAAWPRLAPLIESVRLAVSAIDLRGARELTMVNPRYAGTDRLNRPYVVTAAVGRQVPNRGDLMSLEKPRAVMIVHSGARVVLTAATGIYQAQPQLLDLFDEVTLTHQNGTSFVTRRAHANLASSTAEGHDPIEGHGPSGDIWGLGFRVLDKGDTIVFTGHSHAILKGTKPKPASAPPEPPAEVVRTAAVVEAAAMAPANPPPAAAIVTKPAEVMPARTPHPGVRPHRTARHAGKATMKAGHASEKAED